MPLRRERDVEAVAVLARVAVLGERVLAAAVLEHDDLRAVGADEAAQAAEGGEPQLLRRVRVQQRAVDRLQGLDPVGAAGQLGLDRLQLVRPPAPVVAAMRRIGRSGARRRCMRRPRPAAARARPALCPAAAPTRRRRTRLPRACPNAIRSVPSAIGRRPRRARRRPRRSPAKSPLAGTGPAGPRRPRHCARPRASRRSTTTASPGGSGISSSMLSRSAGRGRGRRRRPPPAAPRRGSRASRPASPPARGRRRSGPARSTRPGRAVGRAATATATVKRVRLVKAPSTHETVAVRRSSAILHRVDHAFELSAALFLTPRPQY